MRTISIEVAALALNVTKSIACRRALREGWLYTEQSVRGGRKRFYELSTLPEEVRAKVALHLIQTGVITPASEPSQPKPKKPAKSEKQTESVSYNQPSHEWGTQDSETLWEWANTRTQKLRDEGIRRAGLLRQVDALLHSGQKMSVRRALAFVAEHTGEFEPTLRRWWYKGAGRGQINQFPYADWPALLIPSYAGCTVRKEIPPQAWDWFVAQYLTRSQPTFSDTYRRVTEAAEANGWGTLPSEDTFKRRLEEIPAAQRIYLREGAEALAKIYPPQRRDRSMLTAGEIVNGDGLKLDRLWVRFPDGEILNTVTGWYWQDVYSGKVMAYRLAKTENTDVFRLSTYDLTAICAPRIAIIDNTKVAANKAMTGQAKNRHRFHSRPDDPMGLLPMLGIEPQFTNPDKEMGNPGAKRIERAFGKGGLHEMIATNPRFRDRGYSQKTAIDFDELQEVTAFEVARFNARAGRQDAVCRGVLSYDQAFEESFSKSEVRRLSESQRSLLLLMPEVATCDKQTGEIALKAASGPWGKHRFWDEALVNFMGRKVVVYYDPENLAKDVSVHTLDGRFITTAQHKADMPVITSTADSREWMKEKGRYIKSNKKASKALSRMDDIASYYPKTSQDTHVPEPGIVRPNFGQSRAVVDGVVVDRRKIANGYEEVTPIDNQFNSAVSALFTDFVKQVKPIDFD